MQKGEKNSFVASTKGSGVSTCLNCRPVLLRAIDVRATIVVWLMSVIHVLPTKPAFPPPPRQTVFLTYVVQVWGREEQRDGVAVCFSACICLIPAFGARVLEGARMRPTKAFTAM